MSLECRLGVQVSDDMNKQGQFWQALIYNARKRKNPEYEEWDNDQGW